MKEKQNKALGAIGDFTQRSFSALGRVSKMAVAAIREEQERSKAQGQANLAARWREHCLNVERNGNYPVVGEILLECLRDNAVRCGLECPRTFTALLAPEGQGVFYYGDNDYRYHYIAPRYLSGMMMGPKARALYSTTTAVDIQRLLDRQFSKYSKLHGFGDMTVLHVNDAQDGAVEITLAWRGCS